MIILTFLVIDEAPIYWPLQLISVISGGDGIKSPFARTHNYPDRPPGTLQLNTPLSIFDIFGDKHYVSHSICGSKRDTIQILQSSSSKPHCEINKKALEPETEPGTLDRSPLHDPKNQAFRISLAIKIHDYPMSQ